MPSRIILHFLRISVTIMYYLLLIFTVGFMVVSILNIAGYDQAKKINRKTFSYEVLAFGSKNTQVPSTYSSDSVVRYQQVQNHYTVEVEPNSNFGYYAFITRLLFMILGIGVLWNFKKIFRETNFDHPFKVSITRRLRFLAALFIISDVLKIINYILFNSILHQSIATPRFQLLSDVGNGIITGLIIFIISVIYQRGTAFQDETALTV